jgi:copper chaperone CopZ
MRSFFLLLFVGLTLSLSSCAEEMPELTELQVAAPGMHCGGCTATVEETLSKMAGVDSVYAELETKNVHVFCDTTQITRGELEEMIARLGFDTAPADAQ